MQTLDSPVEDIERLSKIVQEAQENFTQDRCESEKFLPGKLSRFIGRRILSNLAPIFLAIIFFSVITYDFIPYRNMILGLFGLENMQDVSLYMWLHILPVVLIICIIGELTTRHINTLRGKYHEALISARKTQMDFIANKIDSENIDVAAIRAYVTQIEQELAPVYLRHLELTALLLQLPSSKRGDVLH